MNVRRYRARFLLWAVLPMIGAIQHRALAQATDAEWRKQVEQRMQQLEQENRELRNRIGEIGATQQSLMKDAQERGILTIEAGQPRLSTPDWFDINKYAAEGDFPGSIRIPGTKTSFQLGGFVQIDAISDQHRIGDEDAFVVSKIPTGTTTAGNTNLTVRQTRLFLKTQTPTKDWGNFISYVEVDFFGTDGAEPRIRHAYGQVGDKFQLLGGQTWTAFQDATIFPATLDFQGPAGIITSRRPQIRFRQQWNDQWSSVESIEDPKSEITGGFAGNSSQPYPDLAGNVRWQPGWGHLQLSGVLRYLQFDPDAGSREEELGYGLSLTGSLNALKVDDKHVDKLLFQAAVGNGIARYINDTGGLGLDAVMSGPGSDLDGLAAFAGVLAYQHWWQPKWASTVGYSIVNIDNEESEAGTDYHQGQYMVLNLRHFPADRVMIGLEALYGIREDNDGDKGSDLRIQFSAQYRF